MTPYMKFLHVWSVNIILLLFIFGAIGYILNEKTNKQILTNQLIRYYRIIIFITFITGLLIVMENIFWISFPIFQYKLFIFSMLILFSTFYTKFFLTKSNIHSIITILIFICIYSISMLIGSYINV